MNISTKDLDDLIRQINGRKIEGKGVLRLDNAKKIVIEEEDCNLEELLRSIESIMRHQAESKGLELKLLLSNNLPKIIRIDSGRVRQCLLNLAGNAIKFFLYFPFSLFRLSAFGCVEGNNHNVINFT